MPRGLIYAYAIYNTVNYLGRLVQWSAQVIRLSVSQHAQVESAGNWRDYEQYCATTLRKWGWRVTHVGASGDQGADLLAEWNGTKVVLQCKFWRQTVGNRAVQEAYAAARHYNAQYSAVISEAGYTAGARELAASTGTYLISQAELRNLSRHLRLV